MIVLHISILQVSLIAPLVRPPGETVVMIFAVVVLHFCCFEFGKAKVWNNSDSFYEARIRPLTWEL